MSGTVDPKAIFENSVQINNTSVAEVWFNSAIGTHDMDLQRSY